MTTTVHSSPNSHKLASFASPAPAPAAGFAAGHHAGHGAAKAERDLRHKADKAKQDFEARLVLVETLLKSADLGINRPRSRALERAMSEMAQANARHIRALAALGDFLIDGTHS